MLIIYKPFLTSFLSFNKASYKYKKENKIRLQKIDLFQNLKNRSFVKLKYTLTQNDNFQ